ncbi:MAG TPA: DUF192 domain-containing protein [Solirubrobacteraceae bacterium]|jgi:uncharacterized membrane protein (UPF0127 family)|nr:DUF192 domain-containing protein [Solirubrobacteraceae bacterium]
MTLDARLDALEHRALPGGLTLLVAGDRRSRTLGLTRLSELAPDRALLIERCRSVHTAGMRFALDLVWLDGSGEVVRLDSAVPPRRLRTCLRARSVVETAAGSGERFAEALRAR